MFRCVAYNQANSASSFTNGTPCQLQIVQAHFLRWCVHSPDNTTGVDNTQNTNIASAQSSIALTSRLLLGKDTTSIDDTQNRI
jgi:hypothetical protein